MKTRLAPNFLATLSLMPLLLFTAAVFAKSPRSAAEREFNAVLQLKPDAVHGEQIFDTCAACHGDKGHGTSDGTVPAVAGQHFRVIVWELVNFRHGGRLDPRMQHFTDRQHLSRGAQDIADVAAYVSRMQLSASTSNAAVSSGRGADLYNRECSSCHGPSAQGDDRARRPRLAAQHYEYLLSRMQDGPEGHRTNLPTEHDRLSNRLTAEELRAICDYLSRLNP